MSVSASVRAALSMAKKRQLDLAALWETSPQVITNKLRLARWTGEELARVAALTGGKLAFVYPDGQQIFIPPSDAEVMKKEKKLKQPEALTGRKEAQKPAAKKAKTPAKPKAVKVKKPVEEQLSMFN